MIKAYEDLLQSRPSEKLSNLNNIQMLSMQENTRYKTFEQVTISPSANFRCSTASQWCIRVFISSPVLMFHTLSHTQTNTHTSTHTQWCIRVLINQLFCFDVPHTVTHRQTHKQTHIYSDVPHSHTVINTVYNAILIHDNIALWAPTTNR